MSFLLSSFFRCPSLQHDGPLVSSLALGFLRLPLQPRELSLSWALAGRGLLLAVAARRLFQPG